MLEKYCPRCKTTKSTELFNKDTTKLSGCQSKCRECQSEYRKELRRVNPMSKEKRKELYERYREQIKAYYTKKLKDPKEKERRRNYQKANPEKFRASLAKYRKKPESKAKRNIERNRRRKEDVKFMLESKLRDRVRHAFNNSHRKETSRLSYRDAIGCSLDEFRIYMESKFTEGMSWGKGSEIHIDHIKPCAAFDLSDEQQVKECFHYTNLQPLWKLDNLSKNAKYNGVDYNKRNKQTNQPL